MTLSTADLISEINSQLPDNFTGQITPTKLRTVLIDILNNTPDPDHVITANGGFLYEAFLSGTTSGDPVFGINSDNRIIIDGDVATPTNGESYAFAVQHAFGGGTGSRYALNSTMAVNGPIAGDAVSQRSISYSVANAGGTGTWTPTTVDTGWKGNLFGGNDNTRLSPGATFWRNLIGREIDVFIDAGASCFSKIGLLLVNGGAQATADDCMISMVGDPIKVGVSFGLTYGGWAFDTNSTLIGAQRKLYPSDVGAHTLPAAYGVDFRDVLFSQKAFISNGFSVAPNGAVNADGGLTVSSTQVVGARNTGWTAMTGTTDKSAALATSTVTLAQLAARVKTLQDTLTTHGLVGA